MWNSRREELNLRPTVYETVALPLSYAGSIIRIIAVPEYSINWRRDGRIGDCGIDHRG